MINKKIKISMLSIFILLLSGCLDIFKSLHCSNTFNEITTTTITKDTLNSKFAHPSGLAIGSDNNIYVTSSGLHNIIYKLNTDGTRSKLPSGGRATVFEDGKGYLFQPPKLRPHTLAADKRGNLYTADGLDSVIG